MSPGAWLQRHKGTLPFRLFISFSLLTTVTSLIFCILYITIETREKKGYIRQLLHLTAHQLTETVRLPLYAENSPVLQKIADEFAAAPEIVLVEIRSSTGVILAGTRHPDPAGNSELFSEVMEVRSMPLSLAADEAFAEQHSASGTLIGSVHILRSGHDVAENIRRIIAAASIVTILFWLTVNTVGLILLRRVTRSFTALIEGIQTLKEGNFSHRIAISGDDEPSQAAWAVNMLAESIQQRDADNARLTSEKIRIERQMLETQKLESLGTMAGGIAHDFNNLLQVMLGNMEILRNELPRTLPQREYLDQAHESAERAAILTNLLLTYIGKSINTRKEINLNSLVRTNEALFRTAAASSITFELSLGDDIPLLNADEAQIQQVIMNLITNAAEAMEKQPGRISVSTGVSYFDADQLSACILETVPKPGRYTWFEVKDSGCGMSKETLRRLFDPFFTTKFTGRGLGMSAVKGIISGHSGALFVVSSPGKGSTFTVLLPVDAAAPPAPIFVPEIAVEPEQQSVPEETSSGLALVVDDEKPVLRICSKMVSLNGYEVITARDGLDAVNTFRNRAQEINLVILDLTMPNKDGITAMEEIFAIRPDVKILLASGFNEDELSERITGQRPSGFIRKPYNLSVLSEALKRVMVGE